MLLGGMTSFPIGKSLKFVSVGVAITILCFGGYLVQSKYESLTKSVTALNESNSALSSENKSLKTVIGSQNENIRLFNDDIAERDNRLIELEESQKNLEKEIKQQREESDSAIGQFKTMLANSQCANQRMPDDIIRLQHQRTTEFNRRYSG
ncbi:hypothetical protein KKJ01_08920 [Xenorhabdus bovienii]|uniref:Uncharacterized protein n=1 Tax=Xenorhabdus bovienii TaxID=40576 RepID=A0AAJ1JAP1_XENBV|nr:hypothetical protein [Xenorhabdus bovienii]MDE1478353.1 hypothetical protein [Xenorhabdus bovienii]MDE9472465.1 hypothetical protein [Xenorhabdus bovienii]MDE9510209.1 hypothetical protein [Xenorhabdus bovienii]MDE9521850.1 hypothetical protein [Xenorhabdus bovienii]